MPPRLCSKTSRRLGINSMKDNTTNQPSFTAKIHSNDQSDLNSELLREADYFSSGQWAANRLAERRKAEKAECLPGDPLSLARRLTAAGLSVIPTKPNGSKAPDGQWKQFQQRRPTDAE